MKKIAASFAVGCLLISFAQTLQAQDPFITTWYVGTLVETGLSPLTIPTSGGGYSYTVDWGDGTTDATVYTGDATHEYATGGNHTVAISGAFPKVLFKNTFVLSVDQWGDQQWQSLDQAFAQCYSFLGVNATDAPDLSAVTSLSEMFSSNSSMGNSDLSGWDVSTITNMYSMFLQSGFTGNVSTWDVSHVTEMTYMFYNSAFNGDVSNWNTGNVTSMSFMFRDCPSFNSNIGNWDIANANVSGMLDGASSFDQDLGGWDISGGPVSLSGTHLSPENYSNTLIGWATLDVGETSIPTFASLQAGGLQYCDDAGRAALISTYNWNISDGGPAHPSPDLAQLPPIISETAVASITPPTGTDCSGAVIIGQTDAVFPITNSQYITWTFTSLDALATEQQQYVYIGKPFITIWETTTNNETITIPTDGSGFNYVVDWGDGTGYGAPYTGNAAHEYASPGSYTVSIAGNFPHLFFNDSGDKNKIRIVEQWGDIQWGSMESSFYGCGSIAILATDAPALGAASMQYMFISSGVTGDLSGWDVSNVTNMVGVFNDTDFNGDISTWNTSSVTNMYAMFGNSQFNGDISGWDVSSVNDMGYMFYNSSFNQDLSNWNVSSVTNMSKMFSWSDFNGDVSAWDVSGVTNMEALFEHTPFAGDVSAWDVSNVTNMSAMFNYAPFSGDLSAWDVSNVTNMSYMFYWSQFNRSLAAWDISAVNNMESMFANSFKLTQENYESTLAGWASLDPGEAQIPASITLGADGLRYCDQTARNTLITDHSWTFVSDLHDCRPGLSSIGDKAVNEDEELTFLVTGTDPEAATLTYSIDPASFDKGMTIDGVGEFSWTPTNDHVGANEVTISVSDGFLTDSETIVITVTGVNDAPQITGMEDKTVDANQTLAFTVTAEDVDSGDLQFSLDVASTEEGMTIDPLTGAFSWTPTNLYSGANSVTVSVTDGELTGSQPFLINVNVAPVLVPIGDKTVNAGQSLNFMVLANDANGNALVFSIDATSAGKNMNVNSNGTFDWTPTINDGGEHEVTISVSDGRLTDSETFTIEVNTAPVLAAIGNKAVNEDELLTFALSAEDESVIDLVFSVDAVSAEKGMTVNAEGQFSWTPNFNNAGGQTATITVTDIHGLTDSELIFIFVTSVNDPPIFAPIADIEVNEDEAISFHSPVSDEDFDGFTFTLDAISISKGIGIVGGNDFCEIVWTPGNDLVGVHEVTISVTDGVNTVSETFTITVVSVNDAPVLSAVSDQAIMEELTLAFTFSATDVDNETLTFDLDAESLAKGMTVGSAGEFSWATTTADAGIHSVTATVSDGELTDSQTFSITVTHINVAPVLAAIGEYSIAVEETLSFTATATDADNDVLTFTVDQSSLDQGMSITSSGVFTWTPIEGQAGLHNATIIVRDGVDFDFQTFQISVSPANSPKMNAIGNREVSEDQLMEFTVSATDPDSPTLTFALDAASIVKGMVLTSTGHFSWTPNVTMVGEHLVTFTVSDGEFFDLEDITITVLEINDIPLIVKNQGMVLGEEEEVIITNEMLLVTDEETSAAGIVYIITTLPTSGAIRIGPDVVALNGTFSQEQINLNVVRYVHNIDGSSDSFSFTVSDGDGGVIATTTFLITVPVPVGVKIGEDASLVAYPVPAADHMSIRMVNEYRGQVSFRLVNAAGQYIVMEEVWKDRSELEHSINIEKASPGIHVLQIRMGEESRTMMVVKR